jgi:phage terminase large subunit-like protein
MSKWDASKGTADPKKLKGRVAYAGLDLSSTTDLTAFVLVFPPDDIESGDFKVLARFWMPEANMQERIHRDQAPYDLWAAAGHIELCEGETIDHTRIRRQIEGDRLRFDVRECAFDRWNIGNLDTDLEQAGVPMWPFGQGFKDMSWPTKELDRLIREKRLHHGGNPVLRWMADGAAVEQDAAGNLKPSKSKSTRRIDGIYGLVMGLSRALTNGAAPSPYAKHGIEWI